MAILPVCQDVATSRTNLLVQSIYRSATSSERFITDFQHPIQHVLRPQRPCHHKLIYGITVFLLVPLVCCQPVLRYIVPVVYSDLSLKCAVIIHLHIFVDRPVPKPIQHRSANVVLQPLGHCLTEGLNLLLEQNSHLLCY